VDAVDCEILLGDWKRDSETEIRDFKERATPASKRTTPYRNMMRHDDGTTAADSAPEPMTVKVQTPFERRPPSLKSRDLDRLCDVASPQPPPQQLVGHKRFMRIF
jgi:hypothetical protein